MDEEQIREILESLLKDRKTHVIKNVVSQEQVDMMLNSYYKDQKKSLKSKVRQKLKV